MDKDALLRRMWRQAIHTDPSAAAGASGWASIWEPGERLLTHLALLPAGLLAFWLRSGRGHIVIGGALSGYCSDVQVWREQRFEGLCAVNSADIATGAAPMWQALLACCDHLLGSNAAPGGPFFSEGVGATPRLQTLADRLQMAVRLGYAADLWGAAGAPGYLSGAWQLYLTDPVRLNAADPLVYRVLHDGLMDDAYWSLVLREATQSG